MLGSRRVLPEGIPVRLQSFWQEFDVSGLGRGHVADVGTKTSRIKSVTTITIMGFTCEVLPRVIASSPMNFFLA